MKIMVTGAKGQLGADLISELERRGHSPVGVDIDEMDITDAGKVRDVITESNVDAVMHCAAFTAVDAAEDQAELCMKINASGTQNVARVCRDLDICMMYISTDYVFDGTGDKPWEPCDMRSPINMYGESKYRGELAVEKLDKFFIVRISWVFGLNGNNFIKTMLRIGKEKDRISVVADQIGSPTYTVDLARLLTDMIETDKYGIYHATNEGLCSWYDFACEIFKEAGLKVDITPVSSDEYKAKAKRPQNSRMSKNKLDENGFRRLPSWQDALRRFLADLRCDV